MSALRLAIVGTISALLSLGIAGAAIAAEKWVLLKSGLERPNANTIVLRINPGQGFSRGLQLVAKASSISIKQLIVEYGNGQRDDLGDAKLASGERATIIERGPGDYLAVSVVTLLLDQPASQATALDIFGLQDPQSTTAAEPTKSLTAEELLKLLQNMGRGPQQPAPNNKYAEVSVHYATTRKRAADVAKYGRKIATYGAEHSKDMSFGRSIVTIPTIHKRGSIERPLIDWVIWNYNAEDPAKHFTVAATDEGQDVFLKSLREQAASGKAFRKQALLFVHGYNTSFEDALFRAAQLGHDIDFDGPIVTFSWAARSGLMNMVRYGADLAAATEAKPALAQLLNTLAREAGIDSVHIVAHSMGNAPTLEVLAEHGRTRRANSAVRDLKIRHVVLAAPDVSETQFTQHATNLRGWTKSVTLLSSTNDKAIVASRRYSDFPRAGGARCGDQAVMASQDYFLIDVSEADTSFFAFNHSTFAERRHVITDIKLLLETGRQPPHERMPVYQRKGTQNTPCWAYAKN
jgi:esterase/lipase superfamily enzyme